MSNSTVWESVKKGFSGALREARKSPSVIKRGLSSTPGVVRQGLKEAGKQAKEAPGALAEGLANAPGSIASGVAGAFREATAPSHHQLERARQEALKKAQDEERKKALSFTHQEALLKNLRLIMDVSAPIRRAEIGYTLTGRREQLMIERNKQKRPPVPWPRDWQTLPAL